MAGLMMSFTKPLLRLFIIDCAQFFGNFVSN